MHGKNNHIIVREQRARKKYVYFAQNTHIQL